MKTAALPLGISLTLDQVHATVVVSVRGSFQSPLSTTPQDDTEWSVCLDNLRFEVVQRDRETARPWESSARGRRRKRALCTSLPCLVSGGDRSLVSWD